MTRKGGNESSAHRELSSKQTNGNVTASYLTFVMINTVFKSAENESAEGTKPSTQ